MNTLRSSKLKVPKLPDMGVLETNDVTTAEEEEDEHAELVEGFRDDFFREL
jgi:hypothetical protein